MKVPFIDFSEQYRTIKAEVDEGLKNVYETGSFILGPRAKAFEQEFAKYCGAQFAVGVNSGTDALYLALLAMGIGPGDEVIVPAHTFIASSLCISYTRAKPVFVDIQEDTYNIDPKCLEKAITPKTKAIIAVHLYGQPADMDEILAIARKHNLKVVEDSAQAHGATYKGERIGGLGDVACFSFYPTKGLGGFGDGGMVLTNTPSINEGVLMFRDYGRTGRYEHKIIGYNSRLDTVQAVVLSAKLKYLDQWNEMRRQKASYYCELLKEAEDVITPVTKKDRTHVFQTYAIRVKNRDKIVNDLNEKGVGVLIHYPIPLHLQEAYKNLGYKKGDFPVTERVAQDILSLPMFPHMTKEQIEYVCESIKSLLAVA